MPTLSDVHAGGERTEDAVVYTPLVPAVALRDRVPGASFLKLESLQRPGSFKDRGALNRLLALTGAGQGTIGLALESRRAGDLVKPESADTLADGIAVNRVGDRTFPLIEHHVDALVSGDEREIAAAVHLALAALVARKLPVGANVLQLAHSRACADSSLRDAEIVMPLETRGCDHVRDIIAALERNEFGVCEEMSIL